MTTDQKVAELVREQLKNSDQEDEASMMLLGSIFLGPNVRRLNKAFGLSDERRAIAQRFRRAGIWDGDAVCIDWWKRKRGCTTIDPIGFALDSLVGQGLVRRVRR